MHVTADTKRDADVPHPRVFCDSSQNALCASDKLDLLDGKGVDFFGAAQEGGCKRVTGRELGLEWREVSARFVRDNTRNGTIDSICLSIVNLSSSA